MLDLFIFVDILLTVISANPNDSNLKHRVKVHFLALISETGGFQYFPQLMPMIDLWQAHLTSKSIFDPSWPLDATVEFVDAQSNLEFCLSYLRKRLQNKSSPNVTAIIAPENSLGLEVARFVAPYNISVLEIENTVDFSVLNAFSILPKPSDKTNQLVNLYTQHGAKSLVSVAAYFPNETYDRDLCFQTAQLAEAKGIRTYQIEIYPEYEQTDIKNVLDDIRSRYDPDVLLCVRVWCTVQLYSIINITSIVSLQDIFV